MMIDLILLAACVGVFYIGFKMGAKYRTIKLMVSNLIAKIDI